MFELIVVTCIPVLIAVNWMHNLAYMSFWQKVAKNKMYVFALFVLFQKLIVCILLMFNIFNENESSKSFKVFTWLLPCCIFQRLINNNNY